jgi:hypothetical protein
MVSKQSAVQTTSLGWDPVDPNGLGYMPFSDAAYWIASEGHTRNVDVSLPETWQHALQQLVDSISAGEVHIIGRRDGVGSPVEVEGHRFAGVHIVLPAFVGTDDDPPPEIMSNDPTVLCDLKIGNDWQNQFEDKLYAASVLEYSHLQVRKTDIARLWPQQSTIAAATSDAKKSRLGRPPGTPVYDWEEGRLFAFQLLNENSDFANEVNRVDGWKNQADLEKAVISHLTKGDKQPAATTTRQHVATWLREWRGQQKSEN